MARENVCCFTGHRPQTLLADAPDFDPAALRPVLREEIRTLVQAGVDSFYTGMAMGADLWCAQAVLDLRAEYPRLRLLAAIPYPEQAKGFDGESQALYRRIYDACDERVVLCPRYTRICMQMRNEYMVNRSGHVLALYAGYKGGTRNTLLYAKRRGLRILVINPFTLNRIPIYPVSPDCH